MISKESMLRTINERANKIYFSKNLATIDKEIIDWELEIYNLFKEGMVFKKEISIHTFGWLTILFFVPGYFPEPNYKEDDKIYDTYDLSSSPNIFEDKKLSLKKDLIPEINKYKSKRTSNVIKFTESDKNLLLGFNKAIYEGDISIDTKNISITDINEDSIAYKNLEKMFQLDEDINSLNKNIAVLEGKKEIEKNKPVLTETNPVKQDSSETLPDKNDDVKDVSDDEDDKTEETTDGVNIGDPDLDSNLNDTNRDNLEDNSNIDDIETDTNSDENNIDSNLDSNNLNNNDLDKKQDSIDEETNENDNTENDQDTNKSNEQDSGEYEEQDNNEDSEQDENIDKNENESVTDNKDEESIEDNNETNAVSDTKNDEFDNAEIEQKKKIYLNEDKSDIKQEDKEYSLKRVSHNKDDNNLETNKESKHNDEDINSENNKIQSVSKEKDYSSNNKREEYEFLGSLLQREMANFKREIFDEFNKKDKKIEEQDKIIKELSSQKHQNSYIPPITEESLVSKRDDGLPSLSKRDIPAIDDEKNTEKATDEENKRVISTQDNREFYSLKEKALKKQKNERGEEYYVNSYDDISFFDEDRLIYNSNEDTDYDYRQKLRKKSSYRDLKDFRDMNRVSGIDRNLITGSMSDVEYKIKAEELTLSDIMSLYNELLEKIRLHDKEILDLKMRSPRTGSLDLGRIYKIFDDRIEFYRENRCVKIITNRFLNLGYDKNATGYEGCVEFKGEYWIVGLAHGLEIAEGYPIYEFDTDPDKMEQLIRAYLKKM